jgi:membrane fusion protein (multidrug efflux system)
MRRLAVQQAQIGANQAQVDQQQAGADLFAQQQAARYEHSRKTGWGTVQNASNTPRNCISNRPR